ncbi:adenylate cyclase [Roseimicrobium gellanilyticum]|uniref:Adenylate cyclase n=1 Tax=Roseimicrobium gellanilyticum TaxID=748857 RepID=A0A366HFD2_9BACT|nr:adenylate/guanylate cyclase domain-containing protein [Roseimicrobium gellanilyticum]RBP41264.1 adenylate cyclase [Roseimicrobium gellanilyticum]
MGAFLRSLAGENTFELDDFNLVGRGEEATIRLGDAGVSRQHATIRREGVHYWLVDLGSANGSYVNDVALTTARVLRDGDRLQFGSAIYLFDQSESTISNHDTTMVGMKTQVLRRAPVPVKTAQATLLVGDLKGFTQLGAQLSAEQLADVLREWYADCNAIMKRSGAMIDKFIGDCVFAYWPGIELDIRSRAVEAARQLRQTELDASSPTRKMLRETRNIVLDCRIGLHLGEVAFGAMGKGINTALGDAVNLAFRIEGLTRQTNKAVLVSAAFLNGWEAGATQFESCGPHEVKGHPDKVEVFSLKD